MLLAVLGAVGEAHPVGELLGLPDPVLEALRPSVEGVGTVVDGQLESLAVDVELTERYAVGISARHLPHAGAVGDI